MKRGTNHYLPPMLFPGAVIKPFKMSTVISFEFFLNEPMQLYVQKRGALLEYSILWISWKPGSKQALPARQASVFSRGEKSRFIIVEIFRGLCLKYSAKKQAPR